MLRTALACLWEQILFRTLLLFSLGLGSITAMPITGVLATRIGCKAVITSSALLILLTLPLLAVIDGWLAMAVAIAVFGAALEPSTLP